MRKALSAAARDSKIIYRSPDYIEQLEIPIKIKQISNL